MARGTVIGSADGVSSSTGTTIVPTPSGTLVGVVPNDTTGCSSSSAIDRLAALFAPRVAFVGAARVTTTVSVDSWIASSIAVTVIDALTLPAGITSGDAVTVWSTPAVALPETENGTVTGNEEGASRRTGIVATPPDSPMLAGAVPSERTGGSSSSAIVIVWRSGSPRTPSVAPRISIVIVSSGSSRRSARIGTRRVIVSLPIGKVAVVGRLPRSDPSVAVPPTARATVTGSALAAERWTSTVAVPLPSRRVWPLCAKKTLGRALSSWIVSVCVDGAARLAFVGEPRSMTTVSSSSSVGSIAGSTVIVAAVAPAGMTSGEGSIVKSVPAFAVPETVKGTVTGRPLGASRETTIELGALLSPVVLAAAAKWTLGGRSSSVIVTVSTEIAPRVAPVGFSMTTTIVSSFSSSASSVRVRVRVAERFPGRNSIVLVDGVWSTPTVAVPKKESGALTVEAEGPESSSSMFSDPADSARVADAATNARLGGTSSSSIVTVCVDGVPICAPVGTPRARVIDSDGSSLPSSMTGTVIVAVVAPGGMRIGVTGAV